MIISTTKVPLSLIFQWFAAFSSRQLLLPVLSTTSVQTTLHRLSCKQSIHGNHLRCFRPTV